ncbi:DMT family transporter [Bartonella sp. HY329]|uniref:DMT family transporter n=1 Tax=unclassified Bartonella TaxID=2645622 RepID=UPI0021C6A1D4|nr:MULTISPECIES: DMT family transporter [unclassified Bartonella]UXM93857.1 DMT family transporter [Bartonella sp. HY329]UXN08178.1 DMT family transporter [Bartonella sp. HY328]
MGSIDKSPVISGNVMVGIWMKITAVALFVSMSTLLKAAVGIPVGELSFFRSFLGLLPVFIWLFMRGELRKAFYTSNIIGHIWRGLFGILSMMSSFYALTLLPLPESIAISYGAPLILVILSVIFLREKVRLYRWSAVFAGLIGVLIVIWPRMTVFSAQEMDTSIAYGAIAALASAVLTAIALLLVRRLVFTEHTTTIVLYFMISASLFSLLTWPLGYFLDHFGIKSSLLNIWVWPDWHSACLLIGAGLFGGVAQIFMTEAYRYAEPSTVAPFEYVSLVLGLIIGYVVFGDVPTTQMLIGSCIVVGSGIFIIYRESRLNLLKPQERAANSK